jgi:deoxyribodipyrimidine photolyase-related protein
MQQAHDMPTIKRFHANKYVDEARRYVERKFTDHPGMTSEFVYPINGEEAKAWLDNFLEHRFALYRNRRDMIVEQQRHAHRSLLAVALNSGLLSPQYVLERVNAHIAKHRVPLASIESFVRGIIGQREYVRAMYLREGSRIRKTNFFFHTRRLSSMWYGTATALLPLDRTLEKIARYANSSLSERLMVLGNIMLLCEVNPQEVYRWFMEMFIDGYDWSMVPNVYGMSQYADGGIVAPGPNIFPSKGVLEISEYEPGDWCRVWDGLFWRFVNRHKALLSRSRTSAVLVKQLNAMPERKLKEFSKAGEAFIEKATR